MSESGSFESAKDEDFKEDNTSEESSEDEPLVAKKSASPKKSSKSTTPKKQKGRPSKKDKKVDKKKKGRVSFALVPTTTPKIEEEYEVEAIVGHRDFNGKLMYKIRWKNYGPVDDTWESYNSLSCPDLLEAYNLKNDVVVSKKHLKGGSGTKRKTGRPAKSNAKKRRSSVEEESSEGDDDVPFADESNDDEEYEVEKIVQMRYKKDGSREFLVHWKRWSKDYDTWEPEGNLSCPDLIEKFMKHVNDNKDLMPKELRANRKHTDRFTLNTHDSGRRLSKRRRQTTRVTYYDAMNTDED